MFIIRVYYIDCIVYTLLVIIVTEYFYFVWFRVYIKEKFLSDLKTVVKTYSGEMLCKKLFIMKKYLKDPYVLTVDALYNLMEAFCNAQVVTKS